MGFSVFQRPSLNFSTLYWPAAKGKTESLVSKTASLERKHPCTSKQIHMIQIPRIKRFTPMDCVLCSCKDIALFIMSRRMSKSICFTVRCWKVAGWSTLALMTFCMLELPRLHAQNATPNVRTLTFSICNRTPKTIRAIIVRRSVFDENWWLDGWYVAAPNSCQEVSGIPRGYFYYYVTQDGTRTVWSGDARRVCVDTRVVERVIFSKEQCLTGETNAGFAETFSLSDKIELPFMDKVR